MTQYEAQWMDALASVTTTQEFFRVVLRVAGQIENYKGSKLRQSDAAEWFGVSQGMYSKWINGTAVPNDETLDDIRQAIYDRYKVNIPKQTLTDWADNQRWHNDRSNEVLPFFQEMSDLVKVYGFTATQERALYATIRSVIQLAMDMHK